jgi:hypothetical protein
MKVLSAISLIVRIVGVVTVLAIGASLFWHEYGRRIAQSLLPNDNRSLSRTTARGAADMIQSAQVAVKEFYYSEGRLPDRMDAMALARGGGRPEDFRIVGLGLLRFDVQSDEGRHIPLYLQTAAESSARHSVKFRCVYNDAALQKAAQWLPDCAYDPNFDVSELPFGRRAASIPIRSGITPMAVRRYYFEAGKSGVNDAAPDNAPLSPDLSTEERARYRSWVARDLLELIHKSPGADIEIAVVGFADTSGHSPANQRLSEQRALTVRDLLIEDGIPPAIITVNGAGELDATRDCSQIPTLRERSVCLRDARRVEVRVWRNDR